MKNLKRLSILLAVFAGCGGAGVSTETAPPGSEAAVEDAPAESAGEPPVSGESIGTNTHVDNGTAMDLWVFQDLHATFYTAMADVWNEQNPDKPINLTVTSGESTACR